MIETWIFEPGHTEAEFRAQHMMVTWVRGLFKDIHGWLEFGWDRYLEAKFGREIDAVGLLDRGAGPRRAPAKRRLLRCRQPPKTTFAGGFKERTGATAFKGIVLRRPKNCDRLQLMYGRWADRRIYPVPNSSPSLARGTPPRGPSK